MPILQINKLPRPSVGAEITHRSTGLSSPLSSLRHCHPEQSEGSLPLLSATLNQSLPIHPGLHPIRFITFVAVVALVSFVSLVAVVSLRELVQNKERVSGWCHPFQKRSRHYEDRFAMSEYRQEFPRRFFQLLNIITAADPRLPTTLKTGSGYYNRCSMAKRAR